MQDIVTKLEELVTELNAAAKLSRTSLEDATGEDITVKVLNAREIQRAANLVADAAVVVQQQVASVKVSASRSTSLRASRPHIHTDGTTHA